MHVTDLGEVCAAPLHRDEAVHVIAKTQILFEPVRHAIKLWAAQAAGGKFLRCLCLVDEG